MKRLSLLPNNLAELSTSELLSLYKDNKRTIQEIDKKVQENNKEIEKLNFELERGANRKKD